jgi:predicted nucleic acid-binding protein
VIVVHASVLVTALSDDGEAGTRFRRRLADDSNLHAPDFVNLEVASALRRLARSHSLPDRRAREALTALERLAVLRYPSLPLLNAIWELRSNFTPYDAVYVALAAGLGCPLLTADAPLTRAARLRCKVELLA